MGGEYQSEPMLIQRQRAQVARLHRAAARAVDGEESYRRNLQAEIEAAPERMERSCAAHARRLAELEPKARSSLRATDLEGLWSRQQVAIKPAAARNIPVTDITSALEFAGRALGSLESSVTRLNNWRAERKRTATLREFLWGMLAVLVMMILVFVWAWLAHW